MIDTDQRGQEKWDAVKQEFAQNPEFWTPYEWRFIWDTKGNTYGALSSRQKAFVGRLYERLEAR